MDGMGAFFGDAYFADNLANLTSGLGTPKDKAVAARFYQRQGLSRVEIDALYSQSWLGGKVVDIPAEDATREWRTFYVNKQAVTDIEETERRLQVRQKVDQALKLAAKDGGSALLVGAGGEPFVPLDPASLRKGSLQFIHVVSRWELSVEGGIERDPRSPWFGQAKMWRMVLPDGTQVRIHPSRVIPFVGVARADRSAWEDPWGDSVYERLHDAIRDATSASQVAASLLQEAKVDVIKIPGLSANVTREDYRQAVMARFSLAMALKAVNNAIILDAEEEWQQKTLTFQGIPEIEEKLYSAVAGAADMPVTRLLGRSPAGLNATGKADLEAYYTMVRARQESRLRPALEPLDELLVRTALGRRPRGLYYEWRTLWSLPETDQADIHQKRALALESLARTGVFSGEALQQAMIAQLEEDGFLPGIREQVKEHPKVGILPNQPVPGEGGPGGGASGGRARAARDTAGSEPD